MSIIPIISAQLGSFHDIYRESVRSIIRVEFSDEQYHIRPLICVTEILSRGHYRDLTTDVMFVDVDRIHEDLDSLLRARPEVIGNCALLLDWPNTVSGNGDVEIIRSLKPKSIIMVFEDNRLAGSLELHSWLSGMELSKAPHIDGLNMPKGYEGLTINKIRVEPDIDIDGCDASEQEMLKKCIVNINIALIMSKDYELTDDKSDILSRLFGERTIKYNIGTIKQKNN